jgi:hypothetical protein
MAPKFVPAITTVKSLAESRDVVVTVLKHTSVESILFVIRNSNFLPLYVYNHFIIQCIIYYSIIKEATSGSLAKLGAQLLAHPENQLPSLEHVEDIVYNQRKAFPHV